MEKSATFKGYDDTAINKKRPVVGSAGHSAAIMDAPLSPFFWCLRKIVLSSLIIVPVYFVWPLDLCILSAHSLRLNKSPFCRYNHSIFIDFYYFLWENPSWKSDHNYGADFLKSWKKVPSSGRPISNFILLLKNGPFRKMFHGNCWDFFMKTQDS